VEKSTFTQLVKGFKFKELFNQMGWDNASGAFQIELKGTIYTISVICEKSGFRFLQCTPPAGLIIPAKNERIRIQSIVKRRYYEHLLIFIDDLRQKQVWQYAYKPAGKPIKTIITEYLITQDPQLLFQRTKGLVFSIDEHENITLVDVTKRMNAAVDQNSEKVTKKFYDGFKKQHTKFLSCMTGVTDEIDRNWYASVMLNRLMFCYFIQKRGFLDNDVHYLLNKLQDGQLVHGRDKFYSFYRSFLLQLFHYGLGSPDREQLSSEFGKLPYLNGGIFSVHELESKYEGQIQITDEAFESLFRFFEEFNWHLDTNITATGRDINPDVIGYIFEKYINDRAQMGAYYTKEDITDYIGKNTILPYLFDEVQRKLPDAFKPEGEIWQKLKSSDDQYIYNAVKFGINPDDIWHDLPEDIRAGLNPEQENLVELRRCWNRPAPSDIALPTEIWREVITRRQRYLEVKQLITNGDISQINDFITYNLDIRQFALDLINETADPKLVYQFYKALKCITILDPTCGSGAFLFAAMNILEDLYEACIIRMRELVTDNPGNSTNHLKKELDIVDHPSHPNLEYFIYKSIILNNLYGVDIMNEAVEIAKLRLFLKLIACVDPDPQHTNYGLEPLPDIDFNIRCGNTLVGFANWDEIIQDIESDAISASENKEIIPEMCQKVAMAFNIYKEIQLEGYQNYENFIQAKEKLLENLKELTARLDGMLHQYSRKLSFDKWRETHQPFHWFAEFYEIVHNNVGFDVIIGNPPYVSYTKKDRVSGISVEDVYKLRGYRTLSTNNLYAYVAERCMMLVKDNGRIGYIVPIASISTGGMDKLQKLYTSNNLTQWHSNYAVRPGKLFADVDMNLTISLFGKGYKRTNNYVSGYTRWYEDSPSNRPYIFQLLSYVDYCPESERPNNFPKISLQIELQILNKLFSTKISVNSYLSKYGKPIYYHSGGRYWRKAILHKLSSHYKEIRVVSTEHSTIIALLNSQLFYWYWIINSNCMDVVSREVRFMPMFIATKGDGDQFADLVKELLANYNTNSQVIDRNGEQISTTETNYDVKKAKLVLDKIDSLLGEKYMLTYEEIDYIINYDIKYRLGK
jgi:tRNA1(Val) A37 N6-methylase TrmN6